MKVWTVTEIHVTGEVSPWFVSFTEKKKAQDAVFQRIKEEYDEAGESEDAPEMEWPEWRKTDDAEEYQVFDDMEVTYIVVETEVK